MNIKTTALMCFVLFNVNYLKAYDISDEVKAPKGKNWNFELKNKSRQKLYVTLKNGNNLVLSQHQLNASKGSKESDHGYLRLSGLNLDLPVFIALELGNLGGPVEAFDIGVLGKDKTMFVTFEKGKLRTQSGTGFFTKETQSGLPLKKNISNGDITQLPEYAAYATFNEIFNEQIATHTKEAFEPEFFEDEDLDVLPEDEVYAKNKNMSNKQAKMTLKI